MTTFVLVHGAWHGAWCWDKVVPLLKADGHAVVVPDMPGMGADDSAVADATFAKSVAKLVATLDAAAEPVILVGHSMGGIVISQAAEERPDRIAKLVYLTAFLPKSGESCLSLAMTDSGTVPFGLVFSADGATGTIRDEWIKASFYGDCSDEDITWAKANLKPQPLESYAHPATLTAEKAGRVPRIYIECLRDHAITPGFQRRMYTDSACEKVLTMDASHSPFLSAPDALAAHLLSI